jgi:hypothetical protein
MRGALYRLFAVSAVVTFCFGSAMVVEGYVSATVATLALVVTLSASTVTAWVRPTE